MNTPLVTIIIPVYNAERFLYSCLESVLAQQYTHWELIIVNDGSKDNSFSILEEYVHRDNRIKVINKNNEGVSIARNIALQQAKGELVYFADADDIIYPDALRLLVAKIIVEDASFVKADYKAISEINEELFVNKKYVIRGKREYKIGDIVGFIDKVIMGEYFLWTCLFRMDIIRNQKIQFLPHCRLMEDADFLMNYMLHSSRNVYLNHQIYGYRKHKGAVTERNGSYTKDLMMIQNHLQHRKEIFIKGFISEIDDNLQLMKRENFFIVQYIKTKRLMERICNYLSYRF